MIKIAVCDDDAPFLDMLEKHVDDYARRRHRDMRVHCFDSHTHFWAAYTLDAYHIVLLDMVMPGQNGVELARKVFTHNRNCVIAFMSASPDFAVEGYGVNAVSYLLKPATPEKLDHMLDRCMERYAELHSRSLVFKLAGAAKKVETSSIRFIESRNKQIHVHCRDEVMVVPGKLSDLLATLPPNFVQTHKSYVVNLDCAAAMNRDELTLAGGMRIPVSRQFHKEASKRYLDHVSAEA